ncbi:DNA-binding response regulator [Pseudoalteromonas sp. A25]|uniref:response regulator transcription factor n=1 Tax=Pseudoalteromonas sp. A25 TaxID=116092 RepID=UPI001260DA07|nr:response regulator transcription factor [Pseudoalteromonas sp. A25]BBN82793.1 DNA-binding response regulator [Pseudoalteromonas sp. A25]
MANILVVEDDMDIAQGIAEFLEPKGHELDFAYTGKQALALLEQHQYQLVLLDINLPFVNGYDICRHLSDDILGQHLSKVPVIMMSSRSHEQDIIQGFKSGAWDYLKKPFSFAELSARIDVGLMKSASRTSLKQVTAYAGASLDDETLLFSYQNSALQLHTVGYEILKLLMTNAPNVVKTSAIHTHLWPNDTPDSDPLRAHIYKLRKQLKAAFQQPFIETVKGVGYQFLVGEDDAI